MALILPSGFVKIDYPPILGPGRHTMSLLELRELCVVRDDRVSRFNVFLGLNTLIKRLVARGISGELWVDGSFLTEKIDPADIDVSLMIASEVFDNLRDSEREFLTELSLLEGYYENTVDLHVCIVHPKGTTERELDPPEEYANLWGIGHDERHLKGFIVLELPDAV